MMMDGWVRVLRPFNSISVISRRWEGEHERLCAMKRRLGSEESRLQRDSNPRPRDPKSGALTARPRGRFIFCDEEMAKLTETTWRGRKIRVKKKSTFTPSSGRDKCLDLYIELVKGDVVANLRKSNKLNFPNEESEAFYELLHNKRNHYSTSWQESGIVVVDKEECINSLEGEQ